MLLIALQVASSAEERGVSIGISIYRQDPTLGVPRFSPNDAAVIRRWFPMLGPMHVVEVVNQSGTLDRMLLELRQALLGGEQGGTVYAFLSMRGIALPGWKDGYIGTLDMNENKPESTTISVSSIARMLENTTAGAVYLFADLSRDSRIDNRINERLRDYLSQVKKVPVHVLLASSGGRASIENNSLTMEPLNTSGLGIFAHALALGLKNRAGTGPGGPDFKGISQFLEKAVIDQSQGAQHPMMFESRARTAAVRHPRYHPELALSFLPLQNPPSPTPLPTQPGDAVPDPPELPAIFEDVRERRFDAVIRRLRELEPKLSPAVWRILRDRAMVRAADLGQQVVAAYGISDLLPDDPARQTQADFQSAGRAFEASLNILAIRQLDETEHRVFDDYRDFLESRRLFCEGRAAAFSADQLTAARTLLDAAAAKTKEPIPEISNALGITYLEFPTTDARQRVQDLKTAISHFEEAIRRSPAWPYPRHNLALAYIQLGDAGAAEQVYAGAASVRPRLPYIQYNLGLVQHRANKLKEAGGSYQAALTLAEDMEASLEARAVEWRAEMPVEAKLAEGRKAAFRHNEAEILNAMGALGESRKKWDAAATFYLDAVGRNERLCAARHNLARLSLAGVRLRSVTPPDPQGLLEINTRLCPEFTPSWLALGELDFAGGRTQPAGEIYRRLLTLDAQNAEALSGVGRVEEKLAHFPEAEKYYRQAVDAYEKRPGGAGNLAPVGAYLALARMKEAVEHRAPCKLYKRAGEALRSLGGSKADSRLVRSNLAGCRGG